MIPIVAEEIHFHSSCRAMAKSNLSLAYKYITDIATDSITNKDRCSRIIKAVLLSVRSCLLFIPLVNRIIQLTLRLLFPKLTIEFIESVSCFGKEETKIRYTTETCSSYIIQDLKRAEAKAMDRFRKDKSMNSFIRTKERNIKRALNGLEKILDKEALEQARKSIRLKIGFLPFLSINPRRMWP